LAHQKNWQIIPHLVQADIYEISSMGLCKEFCYQQTCCQQWCWQDAHCKITHIERGCQLTFRDALLEAGFVQQLFNTKVIYNSL
ncbi:hypothetical protein K8T06_18160, partial [bacterium]|nr:hypothetical protein [bacterium]